MISKERHLLFESKCPAIHKDNGVIVRKFKPTRNIKILSINLETGKIEYKPILEFSIHENIKMYKVSHANGLFNTFWVSEDHSMIVYDSRSAEYIIISPKQLIELREPNRFYLVKGKRNINNDNSIRKTDINIKLPLTALIPIDFELVKIEYDPNKTVGYDFTVEGNYTFALSDGIFVQDTMAVYNVPYHPTLSKLHILHNLINPASLKPLPTLSHEFVLCLYQLTKDEPNPDSDNIINEDDVKLTLPKSIEDAIGFTDHKYQWNDTIRLNDGTYTTYGRYYLSKMIGVDITYPIDKKKAKSIIKNLIWTCSKKDLKRKIEFILDQVRWARATLSLEDFEKIHNEVGKPSSNPNDLNEFLKQLNELTDRAKTIAPTDIYDIIESGSRGTWEQLRQMAICKGCISDTMNRVVGVITHSLLEGLDRDEMFLSTYGTRKGLIDKGVETSVTGYTARQLVYALANERHDPNNIYCGTNHYLKVKLDKDNIKCFLYRYIYNPSDPSKPILITTKNLEQLLGKTVNIYSPMFCKSKHICKRCFGNLYPILRSGAVGIISAQSISERTTQLTLRTFHTSGAVEKLSEEGSNVDITTYMDEFKSILTNRKLPVLETYNRIMNIFQQYNVLSVWIEILCRRLYIYGKTLEVAALYDYPENQTLRVSLKEAITCNGWLHGLAFENVIKHLKLGLYHKYTTNAESLFEQLILSL